MGIYISASSLRTIFLHTESTTFPYDDATLNKVIDFAELETQQFSESTDPNYLKLLNGYKGGEIFYNGVLGGALADGKTSYSVGGLSVSKGDSGLINAAQYFKDKFDALLNLNISGAGITKNMLSAGIPSDSIQELTDIFHGNSNAEDFSYKNLRVYRVR